MASRATAFQGLPSGENWDDSGLLAAFNHDFSQKIKAFATLQKILGSPAVEKWYEEYKQARAVSLALPSQWQTLGMKPEHWEAHVESNSKRKAARAKHSTTVNEISAKYQKQIRDAELNLESELAATANPITAVIELGYNDLPVSDIVAIEEAPDDTARAAMLKSKLDALRRTAIGALP
uniref:Uncharacterized protein n=1 Tax=viral metagenome TaxID=1070528 RepID=A0A2V0RMU0_9ZZZZ